jgi:hypothetical protein
LALGHPDEVGTISGSDESDLSIIEADRQEYVAVGNFAGIKKSSGGHGLASAHGREKSPTYRLLWAMHLCATEDIARKCSAYDVALGDDRARG